MKRALPMILSAALLLALLCACTGGAPENTVVPPGSAGESGSVPPADATPEPSQVLPGADPSGEVPGGSPEDPQFTDGPGGRPAESHDADPNRVDLAAFYLRLTEKYAVCETPEQAYPDDMVNDDTYFEPGTGMEQRREWIEEQRELLREVAQGIYPDLAGIATEQCLVYAPMFSLDAAESVLVQVSDAADVDAVKDILQARVDVQVSGGAVYPFAMEIWTNNSRIVSCGNYVMLIVSRDCDAVVSEFNALFQ